MANALDTNYQIYVVMHDDITHEREELLDLHLTTDLRKCFLELQGPGWILLKDGRKGNKEGNTATPGAPWSENKSILSHISRCFGSTWRISGHSKSSTLPGRRLLEVGLEAWKDPTMLSYNCFHLDIHEGAQTQWMMEFMAGPGREIGERMNIHHAVAGDIFMVNARLPRTNAQIRFPREERDVVQVDHTANEKNDRFHIPRH